jgi:uncharacterized membrane protein
MNKSRRVRIEKLCESLEELKEELNNILAEEQEAFESLPESIQESERGEAMQNGITCLEDASTSLDNTTDNLMGAIE